MIPRRWKAPRSEEHTSELQSLTNLVCRLLLEKKIGDERTPDAKSVHGPLNPTYQTGLRRDAVQPDIEAERKKRDEIEAGKSYCSRRFGGATFDLISARLYTPSHKNYWTLFLFFFNDTATTEIYTLSLHDALPI